MLLPWGTWKPDRRACAFAGDTVWQAAAPEPGKKTAQAICPRGGLCPQTLIVDTVLGSSEGLHVSGIVVET